MTDRPKGLIKSDLIGLEVAADYLGCSHQWLGKTLKENKHPLCNYFRHFAGRFKTTYDLLDQYFRYNDSLSEELQYYEEGKTK